LKLKVQIQFKFNLVQFNQVQNSAHINPIQFCSEIQFKFNQSSVQFQFKLKSEVQGRLQAPG